MSNRLADLERSIRARRTQRPDGKTPKPAATIKDDAATSAALMRPAGQSLSTVLARRGRRRMVKALSGPVDYAIQGPIDIVAQPLPMACWAAAFTMMYGWKKLQAMSIERALGDIGPRWVDIFRANTGLSVAEAVEFVAATGLQAEPPVNFSVDGWDQQLRNFGPIWVITDEAPGAPWAIHCRIITAIRGDGRPEGTRIHLLDPGGAREYDEAISVFVPKFEEEISRTGRTRIQVLHWPPNARATSSSMARGNGLGRGRSFAVQPRAFETVVEARNRLRGSGVSESEMDAFLREVGVGALSVARSGAALITGPSVPVRFPPARLLETWQSELISAALTPSPIGPMVPVIRALAQRTGTTIGVGPAVTGGLGAGFTAGVGVLFASDGRLGLYGQGGSVVGAIVSIGASMQVTAVHGGVDVFGGEGLAAGISIDLGEGPSLGAHALFSKDGKFVGVTGEVGLTLGFSPIEAFVSYQWTGTTLSAASRWARPWAPTAPARGLGGVPTDEERKIAREILEYFYPGRVGSTIGFDHVRLAAAMLAAALEKQRWINRLPKPPDSKPGIGWLISSGVEILWNELRGPKGLSEAVRATVALQWRTTFEEIEAGLEPTALSVAPETFSLIEAFSGIPLDPGAGGMSIAVDALEPGDIILSTTRRPESRLIRFATGSEISHAGLYLGGGEMAEAVGGGVRITPVAGPRDDPDTTVMVGFRFPSLTDAQRSAIADFARRQVGNRYDYIGIVRHAPFQLAQHWCRALDGDARSRCRGWTGKVFLGTTTNDTFFCSELVVAAYQAAGVPLTTETPGWTAPEDLRELHLKERLGYVGHLKTP